MADALYKRILDEVVTDVTVLADTSLMPDGAPKLRRLQNAGDWDDLRQEMGLFVCWTEEVMELEKEGTTARDVWGYPCVIAVIRRREGWDSRLNNIEIFKRKVRRHFNNKRRMDAIVESGANELSCRVVEPGPRPPRNQDFSDYDVHTQTVLCWFIESRLA